MNICIYLLLLNLTIFSSLDISIINDNSYNSIFNSRKIEIPSSYSLTNYLNHNKQFFLTNINLYLNVYPSYIDYFLLSINKNISDVYISSIYSSNQKSDFYYIQEETNKNNIIIYKFLFNCEEYVVESIKESHQYNVNIELILNSNNHNRIIKSIRNNKSLDIYSVELSINHISYYFTIGKNCKSNFSSQNYYFEIIFYSILFIISMLLTALIDNSKWRYEIFMKSINLPKTFLDKVTFLLIIIIILIRTIFFTVYNDVNSLICNTLSIILYSTVFFYLMFCLFCNIFLISISKTMISHEDDIKLPFTQYIYLQICKRKLKMKNSNVKKIIFIISFIISILHSTFLSISIKDNLFLGSDFNTVLNRGVLYNSILNTCKLFNFISFLTFSLSYIKFRNLIHIFIISLLYLSFELLFYFLIYYKEITSYNKINNSSFIEVYNFINYLIPNFLSLPIQSLSDLSFSSYNFSFYKSIFIASLLKTGIRFDKLKQNNCFYLIVSLIAVSIGIIANLILSEFCRIEIDCFIATFSSLSVIQVLIICSLSRKELYDLYKGRNINNMLYNLRNKYLSLDFTSPENTNSFKTTSPNSNSNRRKFGKATILEMNICNKEIEEVSGEYENDSSIENNHIDSTKRLRRSMTEIKMMRNEENNHKNKRPTYESSKNLKIIHSND